jgi:lipoprotein-anchoring transpeptidase ErfK/SrfK
MLHALKPGAKVIPALSAAVPLCLFAFGVRGQVGTPTHLFFIHGAAKNCTAISQLDSALASNYQPFFSGWSEKDYADAITWSEACAEYGWHIAGRPRLPLLRAQRDWALRPVRPQAAPITSGTEADFLVPGYGPRRGPVPVPNILSVPSAKHVLPADGTVVGADAVIRSHYADTLPDIARRYSLGYEEIVHANPGVDVWLPGEGTPIVLPGRRVLPRGIRDGVVVNLAEHRLYYFPKPAKDEKPVVITYPVSIGKVGEDTPLGQSYITAKIKNPTWYPPASVRKEHAERGEPLPAAVGPGPDNPLGDYMMRLGFANGTYEIHGTNKPAAVGMANTNGCIGMYPEDMAALFAMVPVGTVVRFIFETPSR